MNVFYQERQCLEICIVELSNLFVKTYSSGLVLRYETTCIDVSANQQSRVMCPFCGGFYDQRANSDFNMRRSSSVANGYLPHIVSRISSEELDAEPIHGTESPD